MNYNKFGNGKVGVWYGRIIFIFINKFFRYVLEFGIYLVNKVFFFVRILKIVDCFVIMLVVIFLFLMLFLCIVLVVW